MLAWRLPFFDPLTPPLCPLQVPEDCRRRQDDRPVFSDMGNDGQRLKVSQPASCNHFLLHSDTATRPHLLQTYSHSSNSCAYLGFVHVCSTNGLRISFPVHQSQCSADDTGVHGRCQWPLESVSNVGTQPPSCGTQAQPPNILSSSLQPSQQHI